jgi:hypothetical protein
VSITFAPIPLAFRVAQVTAEARLPASFSLGAVFAIGFYSPPLLQLGLQGRYYLLGGFDHGMPLFAEFLYTRAPDSVLQVNPLLGYKLSFKVGLTFDVAAGASFWVVRTGSYRDDAWVSPYFKANLGWSF